MHPDELSPLTIREVAEQLGITQNAARVRIRRRVAAGEMTLIENGRSRYVRAGDVALISERKRKATPA